MTQTVKKRTLTILTPALLLALFLLAFTQVGFAAKGDDFVASEGLDVNGDPVTIGASITFMVLTEPSGGNPGTVQVGDNYNASIDRTATGAITIPTSVTNSGNAYSVTELGKYAFIFRDQINAITIPDSVTTIGESAFFYCSNLASVTIGNGVTSIGESAFHNCEALTSITIPDSVVSIGSSAFVRCTALDSVTIGSGLISIENGALGECSNLSEIKVDQRNTTFASDGGVLFNKSKTELIVYPPNKSDSSYTIPDGVTSIGEDAFSKCTNLTSVTMGDSVTSIGVLAFFSSKNLTTITIGAGVTSIEDSAFFNCTALRTLYLEGDAPTLGNFAFQNIAKDAVFYVPEQYATNWRNALPGFTIEVASSSRTPNSSSGITGSPRIVSRSISKGGIEVSGQIAGNAGLVVEDITPLPYTGQLIRAVDISIDGDYNAPLTITFKLRSAYANKSITIAHMVAGAEETYTVTADESGDAAIEVNHLSPFYVYTGAQEMHVPEVVIDPPKTGDAVAPVGIVLMAIAAISAIMLRKKLA